MDNCGRTLLFGILLGQGIARARTAARSRTIAGVVQDPSGAAIVGAEVTLEQGDGSEVAHTISDGAGGFLFKSVPSGPYQVLAGC